MDVRRRVTGQKEGETTGDFSPGSSISAELQPQTEMDSASTNWYILFGQHYIDIFC